jgi:hypothetical protein
MTFASQALSQSRPHSLRQLALPRRQSYFRSPVDWREEVLYFLLVDRFSDAAEASRPLLDRANPAAARPPSGSGEPWRWDRWAESGADRWQGGTLAGVASKLDYLARLGVTALWLSPVFKQRGHRDDYHGYGVQDFLDVDPRFGTRDELVALVQAAHDKGLRVILDIIFNHSGSNWVYPAARQSRASWATTTACGRASCRIPNTTRGRAAAASAPAISTIQRPNTSAAIFCRCGTFASKPRSPISPSATSTGSRSPTATASASTP